MAEKTAEVDKRKGETLEEISALVERIGREFKEKQRQLQPLMTELKVLHPDPARYVVALIYSPNM